jgi:hypothetical protein
MSNTPSDRGECAGGADMEGARGVGASVLIRRALVRPAHSLCGGHWPQRASPDWTGWCVLWVQCVLRGRMFRWAFARPVIQTAALLPVSYPGPRSSTVTVRWVVLGSSVPSLDGPSTEQSLSISHQLLFIHVPSFSERQAKQFAHSFPSLSAFCQPRHSIRQASSLLLLRPLRRSYS